MKSNSRRQNVLVTRPGRKSHRVAGISVIEVLVCLAVIGLILSIALPAVQATRNAAARIQCQSRLKQIATAVLNYESQWSMLPVGSTHLSALVSVRHQLGIPNVDGDFQSNVALWNKLAESMAPMIGCAADSVGVGANYCSNHGTAAPLLAGPFGFNRSSISEITDGLSQTAMMSEWLKGPGWPAGSGSIDRSEPRRLIFNWTPYVASESMAGFLEGNCQTVDVTTAFILTPTRGAEWLNYGVTFSGYNHQYPPNAKSCANGSSALLAGFAASSQHSGGVNVAMMDGSGRFVANSIDKAVWRALGTRAGGESVAHE